MIITAAGQEHHHSWFLLLETHFLFPVLYQMQIPWLMPEENSLGMQVTGKGLPHLQLGSLDPHNL